MRKLVLFVLAFLGLPDAASAACGSPGLFPRVKARLAHRPHLLRSTAAPVPPRLVGLSGGCTPVFAPSAAACPNCPVPGVVTPKALPLKK